MKKALLAALIIVFSIISLSSVAAIATYYPDLLANSATDEQDVKEYPDKRLDIAIAYAYVGERPANTSTAQEGMNAVTQYPSAVVLNTTFLPSTKDFSCDAFYEVYQIKVQTDTNQTENSFYSFGTNYKPSFSTEEFMTLSNARSRDMINFTAKQNSIVTFSGFKFNMTENNSILSTPIGSVGSYASLSIGQGLWKEGKPNSITVTTQRVSVFTINNGTVTMQYDNLGSSPKTQATLSNYGSGFLYNNLVPTETLEQIDLFHPVKNSPS